MIAQSKRPILFSSVLSLLILFSPSAYSKPHSELDSLYDRANASVYQPNLLLDIAIRIEKLAAADRDSLAWARASLIKGLYYKSIADYGLAMREFQDSWEYGFKHSDTVLMGNSLINLANIYLENGNLNQSAIILNRAKVLVKDHHNRRVYGKVCFNLGVIASLDAKTAESIDYFEKALKEFKQVNDTLHLAMVMNEVAYLASEDGAFERAKFIYEGLFDLYIKSGHYYQASHVKMQIADIEQEIGNFKSAYYAMLESFELSTKHNLSTYADSALAGLVEIANLMGDKYLAVSHRNQLEIRMERAGLHDRDSTLASFAVHHAKRDAELQSSMANSKISQMMAMALASNRLVYSSLAIIFLLGFVGVFYFKKTQAVRKHAALLELVNHGLNQEVAVKTEMVEERNRKLDRTAFKLGHDVRSHLATLMGVRGLIEMEGHSKRIDPMLLEGIDESTEKLDMSVREMIKDLDEDLNKRETAEFGELPPALRSDPYDDMPKG